MPSVLFSKKAVKEHPLLTWASKKTSLSWNAVDAVELALTLVIV